jgi:hypothetical protein
MVTLDKMAADLLSAVTAMTSLSESLQANQEAAARQTANAMAAQGEVMTRLMAKMDEEKRAKEEWKSTKDEKEKKADRKDVTAAKAFSDLPKFSGKPDQFENWRFKMYQYLTKDVNYVKLIAWIEKQTDEPNERTMDEHAANEYGADDEFDMKWYNAQLWAVLASNCEGDALGRIRNLENKSETRGIISWLRITKEYRGMSAQRLIGLGERIYSPIRVKRTQDVPLAVEAWEMSLSEFERHTGQDVPPIAKMWALRKIVTEELEKDLKRLCTSLTEYKDCKRYVEEQVAMLRDVVEGSHNQASDSLHVEGRRPNEVPPSGDILIGQTGFRTTWQGPDDGVPLLQRNDEQDEPLEERYPHYGWANDVEDQHLQIEWVKPETEALYRQAILTKPGCTVADKPGTERMANKYSISHDFWEPFVVWLSSNKMVNAWAGSERLHVLAVS